MIEAFVKICAITVITAFTVAFVLGMVWVISTLVLSMAEMC